MRGKESLLSRSKSFEQRRREPRETSDELKGESSRVQKQGRGRLPSSTKHCLFRLLEKKRKVFSFLFKRKEKTCPIFSFSRPHLLSLAFALGLVPPILHIPFPSLAFYHGREKKAGRARGREGSFRSAPLWNISTGNAMDEKDQGTKNTVKPTSCKT